MNSLPGNDLNRPPQNDEIELSIFGPGYGETILVHLGLGDWLIVDSCLDKTSKIPAPISYLRKLGLNTATAVKIVLASHWHDDHIRGLSSVFEECASAAFFCSASLRNTEFLTLVRSLGTHSIDPGVQEFAKIIDLLTSRAKLSGKGAASPEWAMADKRLWARNDSVCPAEIFALSPSSASLTLSLREISQLIPEFGQQQRRAVALSPNHAAVVLNISVGTQAVILGSDLEETINTATGWSVIVDSVTRPTAKAHIFKVPHHGSANGHQSRVWHEMLHKDPFAVLTPFVNGNINLPTRQDVHRICQMTPNAFSTTRLTGDRQKKRHGALERTIKEVVRKIRTIPNVPGHIRLRKTISNSDPPWQVELFDGAVPLSEAVA